MPELPPFMRPRMQIGSEEWLCILGLLRGVDNWSIENGMLVHSTGIAIRATNEDEIECHFGGEFLAWVPDDEYSIAVAITNLIRHIQKTRFDGFLVSAKMCLDDIPSEEENTSYGRDRAARSRIFASMNYMGGAGGAGGGGGAGSSPNGGSSSASPPVMDASRILERIRQKQYETKADAQPVEQTPTRKKTPWFRW